MASVLGSCGRSSRDLWDDLWIHSHSAWRDVRISREVPISPDEKARGNARGAVEWSPLPNRSPSDTFWVVDRGFDQLNFSFRDVKGDLRGAVPAAARNPKGHRVVQAGNPGSFQCVFRCDPRTAEIVPLVEVHPAGLLSPLAAPAAEGIAAQHLASLGLTVCSPPTVSRLDITTDVEFKSQALAQQVLEAISAVTAPRYKITTYYAKGSRRIETVTWSKTLKKGANEKTHIQLRVYDRTARTVENPTPETRPVIRFEHQLRQPRASRQRTLSALLAEGFSDLATSPLAIGSTGELVVADLAGMHARLVQLLATGAIRTDAEAERLLGMMARMHGIGPAAWPNARTARRRAARLRELGLVMSPTPPAAIDLGPLLTAVRKAWC